jgi:hypothetical protein
MDQPKIYAGLGHWMERRDAEALPWMAKFRRNTWPKKIVWMQDDVTHDRYYWLKIANKAAVAAGQKITARIAGQTIILEGTVPPGTELRLSDALLDLDQPLIVLVNETVVFKGTAIRTGATIVRCLEERADPAATATAIVKLP